MIKKESLLQQVEAIQMALNNLVDEVNGVDIVSEEPVVVEKPTDDQISMNLWGKPDVHVTAPDIFAKYKQFYDLDRVPFTRATQWMTAYMHKDTRPKKPVVIDGVTYRRTNPQAGPDWYWIEHGVQDVTAEVWLHATGVKYTEEQRAKFRKNYKGGYRTHGVPGQG